VGECAKVSSGGCEVVCFPTFVHLDFAGSMLRDDFQMGAQDCWTGKGGAFTGEISAEQIKDQGRATWVLTGHSERRHVIGEDDAMVATKTKYALDAGLRVTFCIGEKLEERDAEQTDEVCARQCQALLDAGVKFGGADLVIAYEPVWAIGTGKVASTGQAQTACANVRAFVAKTCGDEAAASTRIQYGGSVKPGNAGELSQCPDIDGFLVGGASLKADFIAIVNAL